MLSQGKGRIQHTTSISSLPVLSSAAHLTMQRCAHANTSSVVRGPPKRVSFKQSHYGGVHHDAGDASCAPPYVGFVFSAVTTIWYLSCAPGTIHKCIWRYPDRKVG